MKELIQIKSGQTAVNARDLHKRLKTGRDFSTWLKGRIKEYGFIENEDYLIDNHRSPDLGSQVEATHGGFRYKKDYLLTLDMAKELCMVERNEIGRQIRKYFIEVEKTHQQQSITIPPSINVYGVACLSYEHWLLKNNYSLTSSRVRGRIRNRPDYFYKHSSGKWYISSEYATVLLNYKNTYKMLSGCNVIPRVEQTELFQDCKVQLFKQLK